VADYKTDADDTRAAELYAQQLAVYARAVRRALDLEDLPRAELWMIRTGRVIPVPLEDPPAGSSTS
jgi:ATP-dependent exoDNAse (exonuclease V) beta subunit